MSLSEILLERTSVYKLWQAPFAEQKFAPVLVHNDLDRVQRVLDVACGPGTNTHHFSATLAEHDIALRAYLRKLGVQPDARVATPPPAGRAP